MKHDSTNIHTTMQEVALFGNETPPSQLDCLRFERLKSELSPDMNPSKYESAVRAIAMECDL